MTGEDQETLRRLGVLVPDPDQEREQVRSLLTRAAANMRSVKVTVVLNLDCNLDCCYCYEGLFRGDLYMSDTTVQHVIDRLAGYMADGKDVAITFYGGEPLLSQDLISRISVSLNQAAAVHKVRYHFGLVTNGTLLNRETALSLIPLGLKGAKFTLDGPREVHDRQRPFASGSGSFDAIVDNIAAISDIVDINLGGNFSQENYREFPRLLDHLLERGITPDKLPQIHFTPIMQQAGCIEHSSGCISSSDPWLIEAFPFLREEILSRGFGTTKPGASACIVELPHVLVINYDGTLYKCPAFMGEKSLSIGTVADGISDYTESHCVGNWKTDECLDCCYLPMCFGGCRYVTMLQGKPFTELDCKRDFLDATLERLILQNMTYLSAGKAPAGNAK